MSTDKSERKKRTDDNDSDVDEHGNISDLIDYDSSEDEYPSKKRNTSTSSARPMRQAAIAALKKIEKYFMRVDDVSENKIHYPTVRRNLTPSKRKHSSTEELPTIMEKCEDKPADNSADNSEYQDEFEFNEE